MATYEEIYGKRVKEFDSDPTLDSSYEGQVWYDKSSGTLRSVVSFGAWASSAPMTTPVRQGVQAGTQTAALQAGGFVNPSTKYIATTQEYNGTGWANGGDLPTTVGDSSGFGTQTAALGGNGYGPSFPSGTALNFSCEYDGTSWTAGNNVPNSYYSRYGVGTQTAGFLAGGRVVPESPAPGSRKNNTDEYDGTNWTAGGAMSKAASGIAGGGTQSAAFVMGGAVYPPSTFPTAAEQYNGTSWSSLPPVNTGRGYLGGAGSLTAGIVFGGNEPTLSAKTETFDGTSWTEVADLALARGAVNSASASTNTAALASGGNAPPNSTNATEEFTQSINTTTAAAWSSGSLMGAGRYQGNGQNVGTKNAGMYAGGRGSFPATQPAVTVSSVEEYDGSSWSEVNNMPVSMDMFGAVGTQTAAFIFGGYGGPGAGPNPAPGGSTKDNTFNYDGTNWTSETALPAATQNLTGAGTQTAVVSIGGNPALTTCNEYDGSSWTSTGSMTTGRHNSSAFGIQTAAIIAGGNPGSAVAEDVESYNGSSWTSASDLIQAKAQAGTAGTQTDGLIFAGNEPSPTTALGWNGTSWFTQPSISTARYGGSNGSTSVASAYYAGGGGSASGTQRQTTEEFTAETSVVTAATLTSS